MSSIVLIVDDDESARETALAILHGQNYQLETASNGEEAIARAGELTPDLILLDVMMPGMDGFTVCTRLREDERLREVPIILLTALDDRQSRLQGLTAGADDFLSKPIDPQELRARVQTITRLNRYRVLMQQREDLKIMAARVIEAQEEERMRISREIHDDIGQGLTAHQIQLQMLYDTLPTEQAGTRQAIQDLMLDTASNFSKLRALAQNLRPPLLETLNTAHALQAFCNDFSRRTGLPADFSADDELPTVPDVVHVTLYRILQEALSNIARHAKANQAWVDLTYEDETLCLTVQDDGKGIAETKRAKNGLGLRNMEERVTLCGGSFRLKSTPAQGTIISVSFPIRAEEAQ